MKQYVSELKEQNESLSKANQSLGRENEEVRRKAGMLENGLQEERSKAQMVVGQQGHFQVGYGMSEQFRANWRRRSRATRTCRAGASSSRRRTT